MSIYVDIKKSYRGFNLNVKFEAGNEILALLGASGCGKSLTLKCIAGIEKPDEGQIILDGKILFDSKKKINLSPQKRNIGLLFQNYALFPNMTVEQNIAIGIKKSTAKKSKAVNELISMFHLESLQKRFPSQLSGGQQQRVALARIIASEPDILMLDEPFSALDSYLKWQLEQEMSSVLNNFKGTTLYVSHNRDEVYRLCDRICVISDGYVDVVDEKWELFKNPKTYSASLLTGCKNISEIEILDSNILFAKEWGISFNYGKSIPKDKKYIGLRAHKISMCPDLSSENSFEYEIIKEIQDTFSYILMIKPKNSVGGLIRWEVSKSIREKLSQSPNCVEIKSEDILLLK